MSLEIAIQENTAAIRQLIGVMQRGDSLPQGTIVNPAELLSRYETATPTPAPAPMPPVPVKKDVEKNAYDTPDLVTYEMVAGLVTKVSKMKGRAAALEILAKFNGAKNLRDVPPSKFQDVVEEATAVLA